MKADQNRSSTLSLYRLMALIMILTTISLISCSGNKTPDSPSPSSNQTPSPTPTVSPSPTPQAAPTPSPSPTPTSNDSKLKYRQLISKAQQLVLAKDYENALPILQKGLESYPDDGELHFLLLLAYGNLENTPSTDSKAYIHAEKVIELLPGSNEAKKAQDYINAAHVDVDPSKLTRTAVPVILGNPHIEENAAYELPQDTLILKTTLNLNRNLKKKLWLLELYPQAIAKEDKLLLPKGSQIIILQHNKFLYSKTAWREKIPALTDEQNFDANIFHILALKIQVFKGPEGLNETQGWMVDQIDKWVGEPSPDEVKNLPPGVTSTPWATLIKDRLGLFNVNH